MPHVFTDKNQSPNVFMRVSTLHLGTVAGNKFDDSYMCGDAVLLCKALELQQN